HRSKVPPRLSIIFDPYDPPLYFVTCVTAKRLRVLANPEVHRLFLQFCHLAKQRRVAVGKYVIMPDHLHFFVRMAGEMSLGEWVGALKRSIRRGANPPIKWQRGFFDHLLRQNESYT